MTGTARDHDPWLLAGLVSLVGALFLGQAGVAPLAIAGLPLSAVKIAGAVLVLLAVVRVPVEDRALPRPWWGALFATVGAVTASALASDAPGAALRLASVVTAQAIVAVAVAWSVRRVERTELLLAVGGLVAVAVGAGVLAAGLDVVGRSLDPAATYDVRAQGLFAGPLLFATAAYLFIPFVVVGLRDAPDGGSKAWTRVVLTSLLLVVPLATRSRMAMVLALPLIGVLLAQGGPWSGRMRARIAVLGGGGALVFFDLHGLARRFAAVADPALETAIGHGGVAMRQDLAQAAWTLWQRHPWLGVGPGRFGTHSMGMHAGALPKWPDSTPLGLLAETGLIGLFAFTALAITTVAPLLRARTDPHAAGLLLGLTATAGMSLVTDLWHHPMAWIATGLALGLTPPNPTPP